MPPELFKKEFERYKQELKERKPDIIGELSERFLVSPSAVLKRMTELGIEGYNEG